MKNISKRTQVTFLAAILFGFMTHMFALVNECPHADVFSAYFGYGAGYSSGRWGLAFLGDIVGKWFGNYSIPWLNGIVSILFLAVSAVCITETLEVSTELNCILISMLMVACPSVLSAFAYIFTTPYYCFSIMLTCCAVYVIRKNSKGWIWGILFLTVGLGIYQAYLGIAASAFVLFLILDCLDTTLDMRSIFIKAWKYLGLLCVSVLLYIGVTKISLILAGGISLTSYESIDTMGQMRAGQIPKFIIKAWAEFLAPAITDRNGLSMFLSIKISYALLLVVLAILAVRSIMAVQKKKMVLLVLFLFLFPCGVNLIYLMCFNGYVHTLMRYAQIMIYISAIVILEKLGKRILKETAFVRLGHLLTGICLITAVSFSIQANQAYVGLHQTFSQTKSYYTVLVTQIKSQKGYQEDMPVAFVGETVDQTFPTFSEYDKFKTMAGFTDISYYNQLYSRQGLIKHCCGFAPVYVTDVSAIKEMEEYKQMPSYPDYGSIAILDGVIVVKFEK